MIQHNVSIIIPHWNAGRKTLDCIQQILTWNYPRHLIEIIIMDNGSTDGSSKILETAVIDMKKDFNICSYRLDQHPGLTQSMNIALEKINPKSQYVMRLDNDVCLEVDALDKMLSFMDKNENIGVIGPRIVYASDPSCLNGGAIWINHWGGKNYMQDSESPLICDVLLGAIMLVRRSALAQIGRWFDPQLFLFAEEIEFCFNLKKINFFTCYFPGAVAYHDAGNSTGKHQKLSLYLQHKNTISVLNKISPLSVSVVRNINLFFRCIFRSIRYQTFVPLSAYWDGILAKKIPEKWWQKQIISQKFTRP